MRHVMPEPRWPLGQMKSYIARRARGGWAAEGGGLSLNEGAVEEGEAAALGIAGESVAKLEKSGLVTEWDGAWERRIGAVMDWKRSVGV
jgi:hypothetical protein